MPANDGFITNGITVRGAKRFSIVRNSRPRDEMKKRARVHSRATYEIAVVANARAPFDTDNSLVHTGGRFTLLDGKKSFIVDAASRTFRRKRDDSYETFYNTRVGDAQFNGFNLACTRKTRRMARRWFGGWVMGRKESRRYRRDCPGERVTERRAVRVPSYFQLSTPITFRPVWLRDNKAGGMGGTVTFSVRDERRR